MWCLKCWRTMAQILGSAMRRDLVGPLLSYTDKIRHRIRPPTLVRAIRPNHTTPQVGAGREAGLIVCGCVRSAAPHRYQMGSPCRTACFGGADGPHGDRLARHISKNRKKSVTRFNRTFGIGDGVVVEGKKEVLHRYLSRYCDILTAHMQGQHLIDVLKLGLFGISVKL